MARKKCLCGHEALSKRGLICIKHTPAHSHITTPHGSGGGFTVIPCEKRSRGLSMCWGRHHGRFNIHGKM